jgi:hypothetical protein
MQRKPIIFIPIWRFAKINKTKKNERRCLINWNKKFSSTNTDFIEREKKT